LDRPHFIGSDVVYQVAPFLMTLSDFLACSHIASLFKSDFLNSCAEIDKISVNNTSRGPSAIAELFVVD